jgi:hypothetical protein
MRKVILVVACLLALSMTITVYAHPGGTDSKGGHMNSNTGEYHYHHGYSPHDHYDIDGDGEIDCPYDFKDNTKNKRSESKSSTENYVTNVSTSNAKKPFRITNFIKNISELCAIIGIILVALSSMFAVFDENIAAVLLISCFWCFGIAFVSAILSIII